MSGRATKVLIDTGPLLAALDGRDVAHDLAAPTVARLGRNGVVPLPVLIEVDHLLSRRTGRDATRGFLKATADGEHEVAFLSSAALRRAVELDCRYADLNLGLTDTCVMAIAEQRQLPILTFDFKHFRATESASGPWRLTIDEATYRDFCGGR